MRFALYHPWIYLRGGIERMIAEVVSRSRHEWVVYTHHFHPGTTFPELASAEVVELEPRVSVRRSAVPLGRAAWTIASCRLPPADALLVSSEGLGDLVVARTRTPAVCFCHTPLKIVHDPVARDRLSSVHPAKAAAVAAAGPAFRRVDRVMWRRYRHVLANSAETRRRIAAGGLAPPGEVEVLHPGVDCERFHPDAGPRRPFFLAAGRIMWQKNVALAVDALAEARRSGADVELVVAGAVDEKSRPYLAELRRKAAGLPVTFEVDPDDGRMAELYRRCLACVFTAPNEDFGIVPLEAMASGAPVLAVDAGGPRETVLDGRTGWLLPPTADAFAGQMAWVAEAGGSLDRVRRSARRRALEFGWDRFAGRVDEVMEAVAGGARPGPPEPAAPLVLDQMAAAPPRRLEPA